MDLKKFRMEGYKLFHQGTLAFADMERVGIRIDVELLEKTKKDIESQIRPLKEKLKSSKVWKLWSRQYGIKANLGSRQQLAHVFYRLLGFPVLVTTSKGSDAADEETLSNIDHPFIPEYLRLTKYEKALNVYIKGYAKEVVDGRIHPMFNLDTVSSFRSSSQRPNFQNIPIRNKEISKLLRSIIIPSKGCALVENDFKGIEVGVAACYHKDANFIRYITTPGKDMHRDMAAQIYKLKPEEVSKDTRYGAKNKFVFPQFYGSYYVNCAPDLWDWIEKGKLVKEGTALSLYDNLAYKGIDRLGECDPDQDTVPGTFEHHVRKVEKDFWQNRFKDYGQWKKDWYAAYQKKGYFDLYTGFRVQGALSKNQVCNIPIQGSAFHCLLWSVIQINRMLPRYRMKSRIVGQIHDSLLGDVPEKELRDYLEIVEDVTTNKLRKHYRSWLIVPLEIENEICPPGTSWFDKRPFVFKSGYFHHPKHPERRTQNINKFLNVI